MPLAERLTPAGKWPLTATVTLPESPSQTPADAGLTDSEKSITLRAKVAIRSVPSLAARIVIAWLPRGVAVVVVTVRDIEEPARVGVIVQGPVLPPGPVIVTHAGRLP
jgi:hypothetical protein